MAQAPVQAPAQTAPQAPAQAEQQALDQPASQAAARELTARPLRGAPTGIAALILGGGPPGEIALAPFAAAIPGTAVAHAPLPPDADTRAAGSPAAAATAAGDPASSSVLLVVEIDGTGLLGTGLAGLGTADTRTVDTGTADMGPVDAGTADTGPVDAGPVDSAPADSAPAERLEAAIYLYALAADGAVRGFFARSVAVDLATSGERLAAGGLRLLGTLELPPGAYELRFLVHEPASGRHGLRSTRVVVPAAVTPPFAAASGAAASGAAAAGGTAGGSWLLAAGADDAAFALLEQAGLPLPSALPVLTGDVAELDLLAHRNQLPAAQRLEVRFGDAGGRTLARVTARLAAREATAVPGVDHLRLSIPLAGVEPGSYFLTVAPEGQPSGPPLAPPRTVVVPGIAAEHSIEWTDVLHERSGGGPGASGNPLATSSTPRAELALERGRRRRGDPALRRATAAAYRAVLTRLAAGERLAALDDLVRIEAEAARAPAADAFATLAEAEADVLAALTAADPDSLLPVVPLHLAAYERHRAAGAYALTTHSRNLAVAAAEGFAAGGGADAARLAAALTVLGAELQEGQVRVAAQRLLERAVELDPTSRPALLRLAAGHEKAADPSAAAATLRRLLAVDTKAPEGRVRLAVNLRRLGDPEAEVLLRRLITEDNPPWVLSLAYQELARELLDAGRAEEGWSVLEQGAARLPADLGLAAARAHAAERSGRPARAREVVEALRPNPGAASPRHRYARWPREGLAEAEAMLDGAALLRLPALARALAASEAPAGRRRR